MNIEELTKTWNCFLDDNYSSRPRFYATLKRASFVETDDGFELRIPVTQEQEDWIAENSLGDI